MSNSLEMWVVNEYAAEESSNQIKSNVDLYKLAHCQKISNALATLGLKSWKKECMRMPRFGVDVWLSRLL